MPDLNPDQLKALEVLRSEENVFLTGGAGSGKSFLVSHFMQEKDPKTFPVLASTGAAAVRVGGRTFHSFFGLGIMEGGPEAVLEKASRDRKLKTRLKKTEGFILDEVSMIPKDAFETAEKICRLLKNENEPWGGLRVICVGDFAQLPPVTQGFHRSQKKPWAFLSSTWRWSQFQPALLRANIRVKDPTYIKWLSQVRENKLSPELFDFLDSQTREIDENFPGTVLFAHRKPAADFNHMKLDELPNEPTAIETIYWGPTKNLKSLKQSAPIPEVLYVKPDCLVMMRTNDPKQRFVNGSLGTVDRIGKEHLSIVLDNGRTVRLEKTSFHLLNAEGDIVATATNYPISLAYATTIHKSQGATLDRMAVDLRRLWEPGQAYVALSRIQKSEDLTICGWQKSSFKTDPNVTTFYQWLAQKYQLPNVNGDEIVN